MAPEQPKKQKKKSCCRKDIAWQVQRTKSLWDESRSNTVEPEKDSNILIHIGPQTTQQQQEQSFSP